MNMNLNQTKIVGLTMELELKTKIYAKLCDKLEEFKNDKIDENDPKLLELKEMFEVNNKQIVEINRQLKELKSSEDIDKVNKKDRYNTENIFKKNQKNDTVNATQANIALVYNKNNIFKKIWIKIKKVLNIKN